MARESEGRSASRGTSSLRPATPGPAFVIANFDQLEVTRQKAFCAAVASAYKDACYRQIGVDILARTQDQAVIRQSCAGLGPKQRFCLAAAGIA